MSCAAAVVGAEPANAMRDRKIAQAVRALPADAFRAIRFILSSVLRTSPVEAVGCKTAAAGFGNHAVA
jgi:hypothetical protein